MMLLLGCTIGMVIGVIGTAGLYAVEARRTAATERRIDQACTDGPDAIQWTEPARRMLARAAELAARRARFAHDDQRTKPGPSAVEGGGIRIDMDRIIAIESAGNPRAVSPAGCRGLCQIAEGTWIECTARMGVAWTWDQDAFQPGENRAVGHYYINTRIPEMLRYYGIDDNHATRIGAYNWGIGRLRRAWERYGHDWLAHAPKETQDYVIQYASR
jgi:soluble lytic murein transglycosylase-like protein